MSQNVPLTSTFRQPVRSLFLILLVGMISFAFVFKAVEYIVVQRETERLGGYFRSIGSLERLDGNESGDVSQGANLILSSPYLAYEDRRRVSSGVMRDIWNADPQMSGIEDNDMWFYGTLRDKREIVKQGGQETSELVGYALTFDVDKVLAGYPEDVTAGRSVRLLFLSEGHEDSIPKIDSMEVGQRYLIRGWKDFDFQIDPSWQNASSTVQIRALDDDGLWYIPVEAGAEVDLNVPSVAGIKNDIDIMNENEHALLLIGTSDMSALPQMQESSRLFFLVEGRWLNHQDDLDGRRAIVIQRDFAVTRGLKVGDSISMTLRGLQDPINAYIQGKDRENWRSYPTYQVTFEIVGIYDDLVGLSPFHYTYAYVPNSVLPADAVYPDDILYLENYSFVLDSSRHQEAFVNQYRELLAQLGFGLTFVENNGAAFWVGVLPLRRSALAGLLIYGLVLLLALALAVFLYLSQRRKDYAVLRALGVPKDQANHQVLLPILFIGAAGVIAGGVPAWTYALANTVKTFSKLPTPAGVLPSTTLNPFYFGTFCVGLFLLLFGYAWAGVRILADKPILDLLGRTAPAGTVKRPAKRIQQTTASLQPGAIAASTAMPEGRSLDETTPVPHSAEHRIQQAIKIRPVRGMAVNSALARFGFRHIGRSGLRSLLTTLVALGLALTLGWMQWTMDKNRVELDRLYDTTVVEAEIVEANSRLTASTGGGIIANRTVEQLLASGFVRSAYTEAAARVTQVISHTNPDMDQEVDFSILAFDQPVSFFATLSTRDTVQYAAGWDESLFTESWDADSLHQHGAPAVFPESILNSLDLKLGDVVDLTEESGTVYPYLVAGQYTGGSRQYSGNLLKWEGEPILLPLSALRVIQGNNLYYSTAKFVIDPAKNRDLPAFEEEMRKMVSGQGAGRLPLRIHFWDEELRSVVEPMEKNLTLLEVLYPVTVAVSALIGAGLSLLMMLQQARDAALLRTLGVGKTRVRAMLCSEQILLSLTGVLLGLGLLGILRQNPGAVLARLALTPAGSYLLGALIGSLIGAISVSNKKPLELLQVKE